MGRGCNRTCRVIFNVVSDDQIRCPVSNRVPQGQAPASAVQEHKHRSIGSWRMVVLTFDAEGGGALGSVVMIILLCELTKRCIRESVRW